MDRRVALKNLGLGFGYAVATPTLLSILQSCTSEASLPWTPVLLSANQAHVLTLVVDVMLPKTDSPSASEVNIPQFVDKLLAETVPAEDQPKSLQGLDAFIAEALASSGKSNPADLTEADVDVVLAATLKISAEARAALTGGMAEAAAWASEIRGTAIWAYKNSEVVGEQHLAYDPVPGQWIACGNLQELTQGKVYSL
ncbi:MAG: gluconate 2-dehydrogenase subunit 3 family protein [Flavobacteriaceae bacterium]